MIKRIFLSLSATRNHQPKTRIGGKEIESRLEKIKRGTDDSERRRPSKKSHIHKKTSIHEHHPDTNDPVHKEQ
jgi:hypothetical protein